MASNEIPVSERLIVALDYSRKEEALGLVRTLGPQVSFYKVGYTLFLSAGKEFVETLIHEHRKKVFLDLKMNDIGATMEDAVRVIAGMGVEFLTLYGTSQTVAAAIKGRGDRKTPRFLSVTYLSSLDQTDLKDTFGDKPVDLPAYIRRRAEMLVAAGSDGLIASGESVADIRSSIRDRHPVLVVPGIRPPGSSTNDHKRTLTPSEAIRAGADYLVVGRPIRDAADPVQVAKLILADIEAALKR